MKTAKAPLEKKRSLPPKAVSLSSIGARVLGRCRVMTDPSFPARRIGLEFPALNAVELESVIGELVDKQLVSEHGHGERATYSITDRGRAARVSVG